MLENRNDFQGKTVLDVGAGSGILSFFAARAGAKKVYAVEASGMAVKAAKLAKGNGLDGVVEVLHQKVEDVQLKERVDGPIQLLQALPMKSASRRQTTLARFSRWLAS